LKGALRQAPHGATFDSSKPLRAYYIDSHKAGRRAAARLLRRAVQPIHQPFPETAVF